MRNSKLKWIYMLGLMGFIPAVSHADNSKLNLQCSINITNYKGVEHAVITKKLVLTALKHKDSGHALVSQTDDFEFWVMIHGQQSINGRKFVNNFQVAIKDKKTGIFMHALSDTNNMPEKYPLKARISLVEYYKKTFLEDGELIFECLSI